jgi:hypothetical protein
VIPRAISGFKFTKDGSNYQLTADDVKKGAWSGITLSGYVAGLTDISNRSIVETGYWDIPKHEVECKLLYIQPLHMYKEANPIFRG